MNRTLTTGLLSLAATGALAIGLSAPATAVGVMGTAYHGSDYATAYWSNSTGGNIYACDMERDGNGVYADVYFDNGGHVSIWDDNGSNNGCGGSGGWASIAKYRVCEDHVGCSAWKTDA